ncbi:acetyl-CoA synthetase-like protein [Mycena leptocephala]|nr:acetyl-CoA synthetase-like protein [Mycena leptocephala]
MSPRTTPQGVNSSTFHPAPFDHDLSIPELYKYHARNSPTHPVFMYSDLELGTTKFVTYHEAWLGICRAAAIVSGGLSESGRGTNQQLVMAVLALSDTLSYIYLLIAIMSLGHTTFPMSPRNSAEVIAHLLKATRARRIFTNTEGPVNALAKQTAVLLAKEGVQLDLLPMAQYEELMQEPDAPDATERLPERVQPDDIVLILHSSGTTAFPKPIKITKRGIINLANIPCYGELDLTNKRIAAHTNPSFHAMGLATYIWPLTSGAIFAIYNPKPVIPTPANFLASWVTDKCDIVFCVPVFIEVRMTRFRENKRSNEVTKKATTLNKSIGDMLAEEGIVMHPFWGSTEIGPATMFIPGIRPRETSGSTSNFQAHRPIVIPTEICFPFVMNTMHDDKPAFDDDQIMLSTAENVNPVPLDKHINSVLIFGRHRLPYRILVEPAPDVHTDQLEPTIERANSKAPAYARIQKNMIIFTSASKPLEYTPKGTPRRAMALRLYSAEIDALYDNAEEGPLGERQFPDRA